MNRFAAALIIARKDLKLAFRDRTGLLVGFGLPVVLVLAFGFIYQMTFGRPGGMSRTGLSVRDSDETPTSQAFLAELRASKFLAVDPEEGAPQPDAAKLRKQIEDGDIHHALIIDAGFEQTLKDGKLPKVTLLRDPGREMEDQLVSIGILQALISSQGTSISSALTTRAMIAAGLPESYTDRIDSLSRGFSQAIGTLFAESGTPAPSTSTEGTATGTGANASKRGGISLEDVFGKVLPVERVDIQSPQRPAQLSYMMAHNIAGIATMMLMFGLVACASVLLTERDEGTLRRLLLAPVDGTSLLLGKFLYAAIMGAIQLVILFAVGSAVFQVNVLRDPLTLGIASLALLACVTSFGMLIAVIAKSVKQAEGMSTVLILLMSALGGAWFPLEMFSLPPIGEIVTHCTLTYWGVHALKATLYHGKDFTDASFLRDIAVLLGFAVVAGAATVALFRKRFLGSLAR